MRKIKKVHITAHRSFYDKMEYLRKKYREKTGLNLSQEQATNILAQNIKIPKIPQLLKEKKQIKKGVKLI